jgi:CRISPR-associated protein Cmr2
MTVRGAGNELLRVSIGPVQPFVAQSRRTRDLWSSSYLLSYLAGCAIDAAELAGGQIRMPATDGDVMMEAIRAVRMGREPAEIPEIGSLPNQFTLAASNPAEVGKAAVDGFHAAWRGIVGRAQKALDTSMRTGSGSIAIWNRQVAEFWQVQWVYGNSAALARRKSWRGGHRAAEAGDKCALMSGWQELSGYCRSTDRNKQDAFWASVQREIRGFDFREDERLCAIAVIKRLFPAIAKDAIGWELNVENQAVHWPSTAYLAARPWVDHVLLEGDSYLRSRADAYAEIVGRAARPAHKEESGWEKLKKPATEADSAFGRLDGGFYFENDILLENRTPLMAEAPERAFLADQLRELCRAASEQGLQAEPSPLFGVLLLDGDLLGSQFATADDPVALSKSLAGFARRARKLVYDRGGLTVYAGGDDLLAFVPLPASLGIALALEKLYFESLKTPKSESSPTLSAALILAHYHAPLRTLLSDAHRMLDEEAKERNGRNSIAFAVRKSSGTTVRWVTTWEHLRAGDREQGSSRLGRVCSMLDDGRVSSSFLYGQRRVLTRLAGSEPWQPGLVLELPPSIDHGALVRAELARARKEDPEVVAGDSQELAEIMHTARRGETGVSTVTSSRVCLDPILLAHLLSRETPRRTKVR